MPLFQLSVPHHRDRVQARERLAAALREVQARFGPTVQTVAWSDDRDSVHVAGAGFVVDLRVDDTQVHASGDVLGLGALLGKPLEAGVRQIVHQAFGKG